LYESIPRRIAAVLKAKVVQHHINKESCAVSVVFPLFSSSPRNASCCVILYSYFLNCSWVFNSCCVETGTI
jgi:hypothetical protein